ncbi:hypothetical protein [Streptomyces sp. NPDC021622]|uniref:hypothetical protein n=1 Tax=Streptomyces sp. NPDC021622 TaxID=3155013 RepID=UPI0033CEFA5F
MTAIGLRLATASDSEYCFQLHKAAMGADITAIWGWDEHVQRGFHARAFTRRLSLHEVTRHSENDIKIRMSTNRLSPARSTDLDNRLHNRHPS